MCKCQAHTNSSDPVSLGNARADAAAKTAALTSQQLQHHTSSYAQITADIHDTLASLQTFATIDEVRLWKSHGASKHDGVWYGPDSKPCLPKHFFSHFAKLTHGLDHVSKSGMVTAITQNWYTKGFTIYAQKHCQSCAICIAHNAGKGTHTTPAAHPAPSRPFEHLMMDFIELTPAEGRKYCLVMVDMWSKYVEAFPCKQASSNSVVKALLTEILPRWGIPTKISSDNGAH